MSKLDFSRFLQALLVLTVLLVSLWAWSFSFSLMRADFASMPARYQIDGWLAGKRWDVAEWVKARNALDEAVEITPDNPMLHDYLGSLYAIRGVQAWPNDVLRKAFFAEALKHQQHSLRLRSINGPAWASLALSQFALGVPAAELNASLMKAWQLGRNELRVRPVLCDLTLANWAIAPAELKQWVLERYRKGGESERHQIEALAKKYRVSLE